MGLVSEQTLDTERLLTRNELRRLLPGVHAIFKTMEWEWDFEVSGLQSWDDFCHLVKEIDEIDPQSYCFRYPVTKDGDAALPKHFIVNIISFARTRDPILDLLDAAITGLEEHWQNTTDVVYFLLELFENPNDEA
jgi:hypothetical protein